ncbi:hypothetical protein B5U98_07570 [Bosea sp. Tri-39]|nr:hypothetical protein BLM15_01655 [Bosea sp. Tri-49]RXT26377.1 hypothetical protein B5U98_07570 [Bosea sp. Tri-39]RXT31617.1 hypothetical protein B5U99_23115 [Bosea sp. Tri-54]
MVLRRCVLLGLLTLAAAPVSGAGAQGLTAPAPPDEKTVADAYVYLLGRALVIRQEQIDSKVKGFAYNQIKYNPLGSADFVNPNFDVAYLEAWFAVDDKTPVILEVPEVKGRYYTAQLLDEWGEVIANINERTFPSKPFGKFALVKPGSTAKIPADAARIELHSSKAKMLGRVELKGEPDGAVKLQHAFKVSTGGKPAIAKPVALPMFENKGLIGAEIFDKVDTTLASALDVAPNAAEMQQKVRAVAAYAASGKEARAAIDTQLKKVVPEFQEYAFTKSAPYRNHWVGGSSTGNYGKDHWLRTTANYAGIWANSSDEVMYFAATRDAEEKPLNGSNSYVMHFPADRLPQNAVNAYWSVILVGVPDYRVAPNPLNRFNFNTYSPLAKEADGSLKIAIGPKPAAGVPDSNWLPSPEGKPFSLTFRTYVPKDVVKKGEWQPAAVTPVK